MYPPDKEKAAPLAEKAANQSQQLNYSTNTAKMQAPASGLSPFAKDAAHYIQLGVSVIPIIHSSKKPAISWKEYQTRLPTLEEVAKWSLMPQVGIAVVLGKISGVVALDIDYAKQEQLDKLWQIIPRSPVIKIGKKGETHFYNYSNESTQRWGVEKGERYAELLSDKCYTIIPDSIHPDTGKSYYWVGESLLEHLSKIRGAA